MTFAISVGAAQSSIHPVPCRTALTLPPAWVTFFSGVGDGAVGVLLCCQWVQVHCIRHWFLCIGSIHELSPAVLPCPFQFQCSADVRRWCQGAGVTTLPRSPEATYNNWTTACYSFHWWGEQTLEGPGGRAFLGLFSLDRWFWVVFICQRSPRLSSPPSRTKAVSDRVGWNWFQLLRTEVYF